MPRGNHGKENQTTSYVKAARFTAEQTAQRVYFALQETIASQPCDLSTYRLLLDQVSHVAVLGQPPPQELDQRIDALLGQGSPTMIPPDVLAMLQRRRRQATTMGPWVEGHYRPGKRLPPQKRDH
jgi:hypothetical protein